MKVTVSVSPIFLSGFVAIFSNVTKSYPLSLVPENAPQSDPHDLSLPRSGILVITTPLTQSGKTPTTSLLACGKHQSQPPLCARNFTFIVLSHFVGGDTLNSHSACGRGSIHNFPSRLWEVHSQLPSHEVGGD